MLFNSYTFIFAFLPVTLVGFALLASKAPRRVAIAWLVTASIFFYGWARPENLLILGVLLVGNYIAGVYLDRHQGEVRGKIVLVLGLATNLGVLGYYKYTNFLVNTVNAATGLNWHTAEI